MLLGGGDLIVVVSATSTTLNASTLFGARFSQSMSKRLIIQSGVTVGSTSTATPALLIPSGLSGKLTIENFGSIQGAGGAGGAAGVGAVGGNALEALSLIKLINHPGATIYGGGGGGGRGGSGGAGGGGIYYTNYDCSYYQHVGGTGTSCGCDPNYMCQITYGGEFWCLGGGYCDGRDGECGVSTGCDDCGRYIGQTCSTPNYTSGGSGGAGGAGGVGIGYNQASASGAAGASGSAGGTNAGAGGAGGTGGAGGGWGQSGSTGNTGATGANGNNGTGGTGTAGSAGGAAGFSLKGLSTLITLTNNGTIAGRTD